MLNLLKPPSRGHLAFLGILAAALGVAAIVWPNVTVGVAVALFAIYAFANAIGQVVAMFTVERSVGRDILHLGDLRRLGRAGRRVDRPQRMAGCWWPAHGRGWSCFDRLAEHRGSLAGPGLRDLPARLRDYVCWSTRLPERGARAWARSWATARQSADPKSALGHRRRRPRLEAVGRRRRELIAQRAR
ncbi:MAG: DUF308 domain-containing protein [Solirubrobacterales bacterium]|nr:DUF308 domain-containing protein [Solirubrobacterales bacterium]